jgi:hypothetical protein
LVARTIVVIYSIYWNKESQKNNKNTWKEAYDEEIEFIIEKRRIFNP